LIGGLVIGFAALPGAQKLLQDRGTDQAADMGGEDAIAAAFHGDVAKRASSERQRVGGCPMTEKVLRLHDTDELLELGVIVAQGLARPVVDDPAAIHHNGT
jgi:hypothetical protein